MTAPFLESASCVCVDDNDSKEAREHAQDR